MSTINNGGPAFPSPAVYEPSREQVHAAAAYGEASDALLAAAEAAGQDPVYRLALNSYEVADAMLKARDAR